MSSLPKSFFILCVGLAMSSLSWEFCLAKGIKEFFSPSKKVPAAKKNNKMVEPQNSEKDIYQWFKTYSEVVSLVEKKAFRSVNFKNASKLSSEF